MISFLISHATYQIKSLNLLNTFLRFLVQNTRIWLRWVVLTGLLVWPLQETASSRVCKNPFLHFYFIWWLQVFLRKKFRATETFNRNTIKLDNFNLKFGKLNRALPKTLDNFIMVDLLSLGYTLLHKTMSKL